MNPMRMLQGVMRGRNPSALVKLYREAMEMDEDDAKRPEKINKVCPSVC